MAQECDIMSTVLVLMDPQHFHTLQQLVAQLTSTQDNLLTTEEVRDLGGADLLEVFMFLRQVWWQRAPLLQRDHPSHPLWNLGFFAEARRNGTWDRWLDVTFQWHREIEGLVNALNTPVGAMANLLPPHLLVAKMLEPVKVRRLCHCSKACSAHVRMLVQGTFSVCYLQCT